MGYKPHDTGSEQIILPATQRTIEVDYYGNGGEPLVFLHGSGAHPNAYRSLFDAMVQERPNLQIVAPCGPSIGQSSALQRGESITDWPAQVMEQTGVTAADETKVKIAGHSSGGVVALHVAAKYDQIQVVALASPIDKITDDSIGLLGNLVMDAALSNSYAFAAALSRFDFAAMAKVTTSALTSGFNFGMTTPGAANEFQDALTQLRKLPLAERRALFDDGRAQAVFGKRDQAVSRPQDRTWPSVHETAGGHTFLIEDDIRRRARYILKLLYPEQF